jgi:hypothetical protein
MTQRGALAGAGGCTSALADLGLRWLAEAGHQPFGALAAPWLEQ